MRSHYGRWLSALTLLVAVIVLVMPIQTGGFYRECGNAIQAATARADAAAEPDIGAACRKLGHDRLIDIVWIVVGGLVVSAAASRL